MKKRLLSICLLFLAMTLSIVTMAQQRVITGRVADTTGRPVEGVTVSVKNASASSITNGNGEFRIPASVGDVLLFTAVGFSPLESPVKSAAFVNATLVTSTSNLNEVVLIGYGTVRKKDLTGAVTTVTAKDFQTGIISTPEQLIAGKVPGVSIISNSGQPGAGSTIRIRGGASLSASNDPLIVVDGVPLDNGTISGATNPLSFINPNDVESFTVLKDASASAIYGTRASNGVIIITTKKGKGGKLKVNFNTVNSLSSITKKVDVLSADEFRSIVNAQGTAAQKTMLGTANTNWQDQIYRSAFASTNNISFTGGIKNLPYRVSIGFQEQEGILKTDKLQKTSFALALNPTLFDNHLKIDINLKGSLEEARFGNQGAIGAAVSFDPTQPVYATTHSERFGGYFEWLDPTNATGLVNLAGRNPLGLLKQRFDKSQPQRSIGNIQVDYKFHFLPELHANLNAGYDVAKGSGRIYISDSAASAYLAGGTGGTNNYYKQTRANTLFEFYLNYVKDLRQIKSKIDVLAGYSFNDFLTTVYNYPTYYARGAKVAGSDPDFPVDKPEHTLISFFGRANYSFEDRYLFTATLRRDGSSRFAPANRWGLFPSVAVAWKIKDERFLRNSHALSDLKLRLGYGITGQQDGIGNYDFLSYYALSQPGASYQFGNKFYQGFRPGGFYADRKWEQTATTNAALDFGFLNNRITGSIDFYQKKTTDLLNNVPQPAGANFSAFIVANVGSMTNKGVEFTISAQPVSRANFNLDVSFNVTYNKNNITNLTVVPKDKNYVGLPVGGIAGGIGGQFAQIDAVGYPKNTFYLYKQVYDSAGHPLEGVFVDLNGDGIINQNDLYKYKSADPVVFFGFSTNLRYQKWSAGFVLRASLGNYVDNNNYSSTGTRAQLLGNSVLYNASSNYLETKFTGNSQELLSDYYVQNASFLRMDNLNIGYNVGKIYRHTAALRLNLSVQNVFVITRYKGLDPEVSSGIDNNLYPRSRIFAFGINLDF